MNPRSAALAALTAGLMVGCSAAFGSSALAGTSGEGGLLSGNQVFAPVNVPINLSGNAIAVLGTASASAQGQTLIEQAEPPEPTTSGKGGILSGNQIFAPVTVPITACGNAVAILGSAAAGCEHKVVIKTPAKPSKKKKPYHHGHGPSTSGEGGLLSGNQVIAPIHVPITACGNAVALLGQAEAGCQVLVKTGEGGSGGDHDHDGSGGGHHGGGSGNGHHGGSEGGHNGGGPGNGHHGGKTEGGHHGGGSGNGHHGGGSGNGHHGGGHHKGGSGGGHHGGGSGGGHHSAGSGAGGKHNGVNPGGSGGQGPGSVAVAPAPHSTGHAKKGGLPVTGVPTGLLAGLGGSVLVAGAILVAVGRRRRSGAAEGGASVS